jgi:rubrerythrin
MSKKNKLPKLNLSPEEIALVLKDIKLEDLLPKAKPLNKPYYRCEQCMDTGLVQVYGPGPNRPCPICGPRY